MEKTVPNQLQGDLLIITKKQKFRTKRIPKDINALKSLISNPNIGYDEMDDDIYFLNEQFEPFPIRNESDYTQVLENYTKSKNKNESNSFFIHIINKNPRDEEFTTNPIFEMADNLENSNITINLKNEPEEPKFKNNDDYDISHLKILLEDEKKLTNSHKKKVEEFLKENEMYTENEIQKPVKTPFDKMNCNRKIKENKKTNFNKNLLPEDFEVKNNNEEENFEENFENERVEQIRNQLDNLTKKKDDHNNDSNDNSSQNLSEINHKKKRKSSFEEMEKSAKFFGKITSKFVKKNAKSAKKIFGGVKNRIKRKFNQLKNGKKNFEELTQEELMQIEEMRNKKKEECWKHNNTKSDDFESGFKIMDITLKCSYCQIIIKDRHFRCIFCPSYSLCVKCEEACHHSNHPMVRFNEVDINHHPIQLPQNWNKMTDIAYQKLIEEIKKEEKEKHQKELDQQIFEYGILF